MDTLNIGIIGAGRIGRVHAESIAFRLPEASVVAITDVNPKAAADVAARCRIAKVAASADEILADPAVDAVLICSSTNTHADLIKRAAGAGKHIFCEKPIALDLAQIDSALAAAAAAKVKLQIGFNRRFDANFARVRQAVVRGEIGTPSLMHIISRDPAPPPIEYIRVSGGMFPDMTIHDFDMARFLIGDEVEEIYTAAAVMVDPEIGKAGDVDTAILTLRFRNGVIATIDNSRKAAYGYDQRVEILGSKGMISTANFFMDRYAESFTEELRCFVAAIQDDTPTPVTGADGRVPVVMAMAARKSYDEHRPVRLDEIG
jgi:myo-inositol 2-dehydrogenase/D-chiro-inositol 1-dehydrogenase